jgi:predicted PurR-regulated permease PerM
MRVPAEASAHYRAWNWRRNPRLCALRSRGRSSYPIIWGAIIAVAVFHGYDRLQTVLGGRRITAAVLVTLSMLVLLVAPSVLLGDSLVSGTHNVMDFFQRGELHIPPPPDSVAGWPLIGEPIAKTWTLASEDLEKALRQASPLLKGFRRWLLGAAAGAGLALLQFVLAILISGAFLAKSEAAGRTTQTVARRLAGERGLELARVAEQTVRSVASGILGVALIQALLLQALGWSPPSYRRAQRASGVRLHSC